MRLTLCIFALFSLTALAAKAKPCVILVVDGGIEIEIVTPEEQPTLAKALGRMTGRKGFGLEGEMTLERFTKIIQTIGVPILGGHSVTFHHDTFFETAGSPADRNVIEEAFYRALDRRVQGALFQGLTHDKATKKLNSAPQVFVSTHQRAEYQKGFIEYLDRHAELKELPLLGLVSHEETATPVLADRLSLALVSYDGNLPHRTGTPVPQFKKATQFHFAGGYLDQCLLQSVVSVFRNSLANTKNANVEIFLHADAIYTEEDVLLSSLWEDPPEGNDAEVETQRRDALEALGQFEYETRHYLPDGFELYAKTHARKVPQQIEHALELRHKESKRTATLRFVSDYPLRGP